MQVPMWDYLGASAFRAKHNWAPDLSRCSDTCVIKQSRMFWLSFALEGAWNEEVRLNSIRSGLWNVHDIWSSMQDTVQVRPFSRVLIEQHSYPLIHEGLEFTTPIIRMVGTYYFLFRCSIARAPGYWCFCLWARCIPQTSNMSQNESS